MSDLDDKNQRRLAELRDRQQQRVAELREKLDFTRGQADLGHERRLEIKERDYDYKREALAEKRNFEEAKIIERSIDSREAMQFAHEIRELERIPNFEDYRMRAELDFLIRREERRDKNKFDNYALERRITELRSASRSEIKRLVFVSVLEHIQGEHIHRRTLEELQAETDNDLIKSEQAHGHRLDQGEQAHRHKTQQDDQSHRHRLKESDQGHGHKIAQDDNQGRLKVSEMFSSRFLDLVFSQMGGQVSGLSRTDVDALVSQWEKEGDQLKR